MTKEEKKEMVDIHFGLVEIVVDAYLAKEWNREYKQNYREDFLGIAYTALVVAAEKFDDTRGIQFRTYASNYIRAMMTTYSKQLFRQKTREAVCVEDLIGTSMEPRVLEDYDCNESLKERMLKNEYSELVKRLEPKDELNKIIYYEMIIGNNSMRKLAKELNVPNPWKLYKRKKKILKDLKTIVTKEEQNHKQGENII